MAKLGSILERQFKKLGIEITDDLKPLIELPTEVADDLASKIDKGLLTIEAAKTNPDVTKVLKQSTLAGADAKMDDIIKELGITVNEDFVNEKNTYEKISMLSKIILDNGKKKGELNSKDGVSETLKKEREAFVEKEREYNKKLSELTLNLTNKDNEYKTTRENDQISFELHKLLFGKDYVFPKEMDSSLKVQTAIAALNKDLLSKGLKAKLNEAGSLVITDKEGNKAYTDKHEAIENADTYIDGVLAQNKLLNINDPNVKVIQGSDGAQRTFFQHTPAENNAQVLNEIQAQINNLP